MVASTRAGRPETMMVAALVTSEDIQMDQTHQPGRHDRYFLHAKLVHASRSGIHSRGAVPMWLLVESNNLNCVGRASNTYGGHWIVKMLRQCCPERE